MDDKDNRYMQDGKAVLPLGTLTVEETKAPNGYLLDGAYMQAGDKSVSSIKIVGRELNLDFSVMLTNVYSTALSLVAQNKSIKEIHQILNEEFDFEWWKNSYCQKNECKYRYPQFYI